MSKYSLVARDLDTNEVRLIDINDSWYLPSNEARNFYSKFNPLAAIDLVTTKFKSRADMVSRMYENGYINSKNVDIFVACRKKNNGKYYVNEYEAIYNPENNDRIEQFRNVSKGFVRGNTKDKNTSNNIKTIMDKFITKSTYDKTFNDIVVGMGFNLPKKLTDQFFNASGDPDYSIKYNDGAWVLNSYLTIRNIIEAFNRYDTFKNSLDAPAMNNDFISSNGVGRSMVYSRLNNLLAGDLIDGQLSLFDMDAFVVPKSEFAKKEDIVKEEKEENIISDSDKLYSVISTLSNLPFNIFKLDDKKKPMIKEGLFETYVNEADKKRVEKSLKGRLINSMYYYVLHNNKLNEANANGYGGSELCEEISYDMNRLRKNLSSSNNLDKAYEWCNAYNRSVVLNSGYSDGVQDKEKSLGKKRD